MLFDSIGGVTGSLLGDVVDYPMRKLYFNILDEVSPGFAVELYARKWKSILKEEIARNFRTRAFAEVSDNVISSANQVVNKINNRNDAFVLE